MTPAEATAAIRSGVARALHGDRAAMLLALPPAFDVDVTYGDPASAYRMQWYPGASHVGDRTVRFTTPDYFEVLRFLRFTT
jgi:D-amino peptidase